jgi:hypothetical protein
MALKARLITVSNRPSVVIDSPDEEPPLRNAFNKSRGLAVPDVTKAVKKAESSREAVNDWLALALTPPDALLMGYGITGYLYAGLLGCSLHHKDDKDSARDWWLRIKSIFR